MIKVHLSFLLIAGLFFALGRGGDIIMLIAAVTAHELSHMIAAKCFGCDIGKFRISALGEAVTLPKINGLDAWKRILIIAAGPCCNGLLFIAARMFGYFYEAGTEWAERFALYNAVLGGFNLLPVFPLDGARLIQLWLGNRAGVLRANRVIICAGRMCCAACMVLGVVQGVLYPPNFSLFFVSVWLWRRNKEILLELTGEFYTAVFGKSARIKNNTALPTKLLCVSGSMPLVKILEYIGWDNILFVNVPEYGDNLRSEAEILRCVLAGGEMSGECRAGDLFGEQSILMNEK